MIKILNRASRAALLQRAAFREAFFDNDSAADGAILVALVSTVSYIGAVLIGGVPFNVTRLLSVVIAAVASWLILAFATWGVAAWFFKSSGRPQTMVGMHGLAVLPLLLELVRIEVVSAIGLIWYLVVLVVATQEGADLDVKKASVSVLIGFAAAMLVRALIGAPFALFASVF